MDAVDRLLAFLEPRAVGGVERVEPAARTYARVLGGEVVAVEPDDWAAADAAPRAAATPPHDVASPGRGRAHTGATLARCLLGDRAEVEAAEAHLRGHPVLGPLVRRASGLRVPGHPDGAELAVRAVLGQQVSVAAARTLAGRLSAEHGLPLDVGAARDLGPPSARLRHGFAAVEALARVDPESLPMPRARGRALVGLAAALAAGDVDLSPAADVATARAELLALRGIGPWTADYVVMRALRAPDVLLVGDLGVVHALRDLGADTSKPALKRLAEEVSPFGSLATLHLWNTLHP